MDTFISNQNTFVLIIIFLVSLVILSKATDILIDHAVYLSQEFGISQIIIGATIVSLGTTLPELSTSIAAILKGTPDFALGNAVGSVITNTALVLGVGSLAGAIPVPRSIANRLIFLVGSLLILVFGSLRFFDRNLFNSPGHLHPLIGILFLLTVPVFLMSTFLKKKVHTEPDDSEEKKRINNKALIIEVSIILVSAVAVAFSATVLVSTVSTAATRLGVAEAIIAGTVVALGTSLPELTTTYAAARKGYGSLAIGNVLGANILNILLVLGVSISLTPGGLSVPPVFYQIHFPFVLVVGGLLSYFIFNTKKHEISKNEGKILLAIYLLYLLFSLFA